MSVAAPPSVSPSNQPSSDGTRAVSWDTFVSIYLPAMVLALGVGMALPAIPVLAKSFDVSFGAASWIITAHLVGGLAGSLPTGWLIDRVGLKPVMIAGPLLTAAMAILVLVAQSFPQLLVLRFVEGWAAQMWLLGRLAAISHGAGADQRGRQVAGCTPWTASAAPGAAGRGNHRHGVGPDQPVRDLLGPRAAGGHPQPAPQGRHPGEIADGCRGDDGRSSRDSRNRSAPHRVFWRVFLRGHRSGADHRQHPLPVRGLCL